LVGFQVGLSQQSVVVQHLLKVFEGDGDLSALSLSLSLAVCEEGRRERGGCTYAE
jgi:hypothetical protein